MGSCSELENTGAWARFVDQLYRTSWVVYAKRPFAGPEQVFRYLGRYTHRIAISDHRLRSISDDAICFGTKNGKTKTLTPREFAPQVDRFLSSAGFQGLTTLTSTLADEVGVTFQQGVLVRSLRPNSPAARVMPVNSIIVAVQDDPVRTVNEFYARLEKANRLVQSGVYMTVRTPDGQLIEVAVS